MAWVYRTGTFVDTPNASFASYGVGGQSLTLGAAVSSGDRIVVNVVVHNSAVLPSAPTVTDNLNAGNYTEDSFVDVPDGPGHSRNSVFSHANSAAGTPTVKVVAVVATDDGGFQALAYGGLLTSDPGTDVSAAATGLSLSPASGSTPATTAANELEVGCYGDDGWNKTLTADAAYTLRGSHGSDINHFEGMIEDRDTGASGTTTGATIGLSGGVNVPWGMIAVVYKLASAAAPSALPKSLRGRQGVHRAAHY